jgi:hypothetical protein
VVVGGCPLPAAVRLGSSEKAASQLPR